MQRWEYCAIFGVGMEGRVLKPHFPTLYKFTAEGIQSQVLEGKEYRELGKLIAQLGLDGWEMIGMGTLARTDAHALYFKRSLPPT